jgi:hypothetical protein
MFQFHFLMWIDCTWDDEWNDYTHGILRRILDSHDHNHFVWDALIG